eukprot:jgi/Botrbrau1/12746/Bobra.67_1s0105.1
MYHTTCSMVCTMSDAVWYIPHTHNIPDVECEIPHRNHSAYRTTPTAHSTPQPQCIRHHNHNAYDTTPTTHMTPQTTTHTTPQPQCIPHNNQSAQACRFAPTGAE